MSTTIKNTCPDIDKCIKWVKSAIRTAEYGMKNCDKGGDEYDNYRSIISDIEDIEPMLEDLRNSNDELRHWGKQMEEEAESLQVYIDELQQKQEIL